MCKNRSRYNGRRAVLDMVMVCFHVSLPCNILFSSIHLFIDIIVRLLDIGPIEFIFAKSLWLSRSIFYAPAQRYSTLYMYSSIAGWQLDRENIIEFCVKNCGQVQQHHLILAIWMTLLTINDSCLKCAAGIIMTLDSITYSLYSSDTISGKYDESYEKKDRKCIRVEVVKTNEGKWDMGEWRKRYFFWRCICISIFGLESWDLTCEN